MTLYTYRAWLSKTVSQPIYDADTVRLAVDLGFGIAAELGPCRLYGIDAPEVRGKERLDGLAARDWLRERLSAEPAFTITTYRDRKGKYGRYLCEIILDDGTNVNKQLVDDGHAVAREY